MEGIKRKEVGTQTDDQVMNRLLSVTKLQRQNKSLRAQIGRDRKRITLKELLRYPKGKNSMSIKDSVKNQFGDFFADLLFNQIINENSHVNSRTYSETIREFALMIYFYSPDAYEFLRSKLYLPHKRQIERWLDDGDDV